MEISRRHFLSLAAASAANLYFSPLNVAYGASEHTLATPLLLSACDDKEDQHWISGWHIDGTEKFKLSIPQRAHAVSFCPARPLAIFFSRRPGREMYSVSLATGQLLKTVQSPEGYHFYGHGVFSRDGSLLFTTENNYQQNRGIIGVYDATNLQRLGEFNSGGIGPHQLELMSDGKTLVAANGGIQTHPDKGREKLNISTMQSSLCYLDTHSGKMIDNFLPEDPQMSIRHLAVSSSDQVIAGVQYQGEKSALLPLVLSHRGETSLQPMQADELVWLGQNQYIASVAIDDAGKTAITTSPRGHSILIWNMENNQHQGTIPFSDVAGAVYSRQGNQFIVSNGSGQIISIHAETRKTSSLFTHSALRWDNHLTLWG
ncbi:MAG: DUF1513 domain-containing protein [Pseudomonadales bacterium]|nr:DUF1513 domain-containing protein [Pseudomonadales bacterium]